MGLERGINNNRISVDKIKSLGNQGLSYKSFNLPSFLVQVGFFRKNSTNSVIIENKLRKETINLGKCSCDITIGTPLFSYLLTTHHNLALNKGNDLNKGITIEYGEKTSLLKSLKERQRHTIKAIESGIKEFVYRLNSDNEITVNNITFSIFENLEVNTEERTISYSFSNDFIEFLGREKNPLTYISIEDLKSLNSNKTSATLLFMTKSMSNLNNNKTRTRKYLAKCLIFDGNNSNQKIDNAFKNLVEKGFLTVSKKIKSMKVGNKIYFWSLYVFDKIKKSTKKITKKMKKELKSVVEVDKSIFNPGKKGGRGGFKMIDLYLNMIN
ncbi:hypothetical protein [Psychromonas aquatilis]|uniref:Uncharacterized protein n=1 Tax=Psychromonas aquatilis TaxID=2005072 RepID=A0ABU9GL80_9GAMM